jgi:hypothetical protein
VTVISNVAGAGEAPVEITTLTADQALANATHHHSLTRPESSIAQIATELVGLHNTTQASPYLSVRARLPRFSRTDLDDLMWGSWQLARIRAMRLTMFVFPHELIEIAAAATRHFAEPFAARWLRDSGLSPERFDRLTTEVDEALADGPLTVRDLRRVLGTPQSIDLPGVVSRMCDTGTVVGGAPPRSWRSSIRRYHRWRDVLPDVDLHRWGEHAANTELILRYVRSYGPVTIDDISWWAGITKGRSREALATIGGRIEEVAVDGIPGPLYRLRSDLITDDLGTSVLALPMLDPYVQGYRDRVRFLHPARHDFVYDGGGNSTATLVQRGRIIGVWQTAEEPAESVRYHLFFGVPSSTRKAAEAELESAGSLYFDRPVDIVEMATMQPLSAGGGRSAAHPLDERRHRASRRP